MNTVTHKGKGKTELSTRDNEGLLWGVVTVQCVNLKKREESAM